MNIKNGICVVKIIRIILGHCYYFSFFTACFAVLQCCGLQNGRVRHHPSSPTVTVTTASRRTCTGPLVRSGAIPGSCSRRAASGRSSARRRWTKTAPTIRCSGSTRRRPAQVRADVFIRRTPSLQVYCDWGWPILEMFSSYLLGCHCHPDFMPVG